MSCAMPLIMDSWILLPSSVGLPIVTTATTQPTITGLDLPKKRSPCCLTSSPTPAGSNKPFGRNLAMPTLDLQPKYLRQLLDLLNQTVPGMEIWAYGSRVNHTGHEAS